MKESATEKQLEFISSLAIDCNFTLAQRKAWISDEINRSITVISELTKMEASQCINRLISIKESLQSRARNPNRREEDEN